MNEARSESALQRPVEKCGFRLFSISIFAWKEPSRKAASACRESAPLCNPRRETSTTPAPTQKTIASTNSDRLFIFPPQRAASINETNSCKRRGVSYLPLTACTHRYLHPHFCRQFESPRLHWAPALQPLETHRRAIAQGNLFSRTHAGTRAANAPAISGRSVINAQA